MKKILVFLYGVVSYVMFLGTLLYVFGFIGNLFVPKSLDSGPVGPLGQALLIDTLLLGVFAVQHSVMARRGFKNWLTRFIPKAAERSTYVLLSNLCLILLCWQWQPLGGMIWQVESILGQGIFYSLFGLGVIIIVMSTFLLNHFDLFGLRQVYLYLRGIEYTPLKFDTPWFYSYVRHPLYVGFLLVLWSTPTMTITHLVFAIASTAYILIAIQFEERDLVHEHGENYLRYREEVPMIIPRPAKAKAASQTAN
ncbi:MAG: isoprenylcysteine carboxylmethyltransferase family protein [Calditrichaeota bacterium]|nr:isoprenylcysteine carboxylmethyltransferase family protein [Calditrichota bacterium]